MNFDIIRKQTVFSLFLFTLFFSSCHTSKKQEVPPKPNIIIIVSDDQGYGDFSAYGGAPDVHTPHMDTLAKRGVRFTYAYAPSTISSISRCGLLTGRYPQRWGSFDGSNAHLPDEEITLAEQLKNHGYVTAIYGKSFYGKANGPNDPNFPLNHGFQEFYGREGEIIDYVRHKKRDRRRYPDEMADYLGVGPWYENDSLADQQGYSTDLITDRALSFIDHHQNTPFFLMVSYNAVQQFIHQMTDEQLKQERMEKVPEWMPKKKTWEDYQEWYKKIVGSNTLQGRLMYLFHLQKIDESIGKIQTQLEEKGLFRNTIFIYISDNGGSPLTYADNYPLKGYNNGLEEGGIRIPMVVCWPEKITKNQVLDQIVSTLDIFPTVLEATKITLPEGKKYDGINLLPHLTGNKSGAIHETLYWTGCKLTPETPDSCAKSGGQFMQKDSCNQNDWAIRFKNWKLHYFRDSDTSVLYELTRDTGELHNLAMEYPDVLVDLRKKFEEWLREISPENKQKEKELPDSAR